MQVFLEHLYVNRELHRAMFEPICDKYDLTMTEITILLLLHHDNIDTAKDIAIKFKIAKSHLSTSIRNLEEKGYLVGEYIGNDHRTIHLRLCDNANEIVQESSNIYHQFFDILVDDFNENEKKQIIKYLGKMINNANAFLNR